MKTSITVSGKLPDGCESRLKMTVKSSKTKKRLETAEKSRKVEVKAKSNIKTMASASIHNHQSLVDSNRSLVKITTKARVAEILDNIGKYEYATIARLHCIGRTILTPDLLNLAFTRCKLKWDSIFVGKQKANSVVGFMVTFSEFESTFLKNMFRRHQGAKRVEKAECHINFKIMDIKVLKQQLADCLLSEFRPVATKNVKKAKKIQKDKASLTIEAIAPNCTNDIQTSQQSTEDSTKSLFKISSKSRVDKILKRFHQNKRATIVHLECSGQNTLTPNFLNTVFQGCKLGWSNIFVEKQEVCKVNGVMITYSKSESAILRNMFKKIKGVWRLENSLVNFKIMDIKALKHQLTTGQLSEFRSIATTSVETAEKFQKVKAETTAPTCADDIQISQQFYKDPNKSLVMIKSIFRGNEIIRSIRANKHATIVQLECSGRNTLTPDFLNDAFQGCKFEWANIFVGKLRATTVKGALVSHIKSESVILKEIFSKTSGFMRIGEEQCSITFKIQDIDYLKGRLFAGDFSEYCRPKAIWTSWQEH